MPKKVVRRVRKVRAKRGKGFIANALTDLGSGLGSGVHNLFGKLFGGKRTKKVRKPRAKRGGAGDLFSKLNKIAKDSKIITTALNEFGNPLGLSSAATALGYGRKRGKKGGMMMTTLPMSNHHIMGMGMSNLRL